MIRFFDSLIFESVGGVKIQSPKRGLKWHEPCLVCCFIEWFIYMASNASSREFPASATGCRCELRKKQSGPWFSRAPCTSLHETRHSQQNSWRHCLPNVGRTISQSSFTKPNQIQKSLHIIWKQPAFFSILTLHAGHGLVISVMYLRVFVKPGSPSAIDRSNSSHVKASCHGF